MTLTMEWRFSSGAPVIRGKYAARRRVDGAWEILPTRGTFRKQLKRDEEYLEPGDEEERATLAEKRSRGPIWVPMTPEDVVSMMETAYQRYIHAGR